MAALARLLGGAQVRVMPSIAGAGSSLVISWPGLIADTLLEGTPALGPSPVWATVTNMVQVGPNGLYVTVPAARDRFFRVRRSW